jgi:hypothetical protein
LIQLKAALAMCLAKGTAVLVEKFYHVADRSRDAKGGRIFVRARRGMAQHAHSPVLWTLPAAIVETERIATTLAV